MNARVCRARDERIPAPVIFLLFKSSSRQPLPSTYGNHCRVEDGSWRSRKNCPSLNLFTVIDLVRLRIRHRTPKCWHAACTIPGVRIAASSPTISPLAAMPASAPAIPFGVTLQAAFANSSNRVVADNRSTSAGPKTHSAASASSRPASKPLSGDSATATVPVPPADQVAAQTKNSPDGQDGARTSDGYSKPAAEAPDFSIAGGSPDPSPQTAAQSKADASEPTAMPLQQLSAAVSQDKAVDAVVQADASVPVTSGTDEV
jgi:hypothetical protein